MKHSRHPSLHSDEWGKAIVLGLCLFLHCVPKLSAQIIATINDPDGYTNLRKGPGTHTDIVGKVVEHEIFALEEGGANHDGWLQLFDPYGRFIHSSRVVLIEKLPPLPSQIEGEQVSFTGPETTITIRRQTFVAADHQIVRTASGFIYTIDEGPVYGEDGGMPSNELAEILIEREGQMISLPREALQFVYEIDLQWTRVYSDQKGKLFIVMHNSDGAGSYSVVWTLADGVYQGRKVLLLL
ncbi:MAG: hypothetical protein AAF206_01055 [Bacteroidota bacterium]